MEAAVGRGGMKLAMGRGGNIMATHGGVEEAMMEWSGAEEAVEERKGGRDSGGCVGGVSMGQLIKEWRRKVNDESCLHVILSLLPD